MSILSPIAASILNSIQTSLKGEGKADTSNFITLLEGNPSAPAAANTQPSVMDSLYSKEPAQPVAASRTSDEEFVDARPQADSQRSTEKNASSDTRDDRRERPAPEARSADDAPRRISAVNTAKKLAPKENRQAEQGAPAPAKADKEEKVATKEDSDPSDDINALQAVIQGKIEALSNVLSLLAGMVGATAVSQVSVQVIQQSVTVEGTLDVQQPLADLSGRFEQLMAAISADQNLPADLKDALAKTFGDFKSLINTFTKGELDPLVDVNDTISAQATDIQTDLATAMQLLPKKAGAAELSAPLAKALKQMNDWVSDVKQLSASKQFTQVPVGNVTTDIALDVQPKVAPEARGPQTAAHALAAAATAPKIVSDVSAVTPKDVADTSIVMVSAKEAPALAAANTAAPLQPNIVSNHTAPVAAAIAASSEAAGNFSGNASTGGQGGQQSQTSPLAASGTATPAGAAAPGSTSPFASALKAANPAPSAPVADQVVFNIRTALKSGAKQIEIRLDPEELGKLHIKLDISSDGKASGIVITADNKYTLELLQRDVRGLQQALADAGIDPEGSSLSFNLRDGQQQQEDKRQQMASYAAPPKEEEEISPLAVVTRSYVVSTADGLDIQI